VADHPVPPEVLATAQERSRARAAQDWSRADTLKASIEAAGWRVVDRGLTFRLWPALPADIEDAGRLCHGTPDAVPSRMQEADEAGATILVTASAGSMAGSVAGLLADTLTDLRRHAPPGTGLLVVVPREVSPSEVADASEVVWTASPFTAGAAMRAGLRRAAGELVVVSSPRHAPAGDVVTPLRDALRDPSVAIAGADGSLSADLWHYEPAGGDVTVVGDSCYAFRRQDALARDRVDDRLVLPGSVAAWLSLLLRDGGPAGPTRRAVTVALPLGEGPGNADDARLKRSRAVRRDAYRVAERFRDRPTLRAADEEVSGLPGQRPDHHDDHKDAHEESHPGDLA
jgi:hypothetical protein